MKYPIFNIASYAQQTEINVSTIPEVNIFYSISIVYNVVHLEEELR